MGSNNLCQHQLNCNLTGTQANSEHDSSARRANHKVSLHRFLWSFFNHRRTALFSRANQTRVPQKTARPNLAVPAAVVLISRKTAEVHNPAEPNCPHRLEVIKVQPRTTSIERSYLIGVPLMVRTGQTTYVFWDAPGY